MVTEACGNPILAKGVDDRLGTLHYIADAERNPAWLALEAGAYLA